MRLGLRFVQGLRERAGRAIEAGRAARPFADAADLARRAGLQKDELERLADAGALAPFGLSRRAALWQAARVGASEGPLFDRLAPAEGSPLPEMTPEEETAADYRSSRLTVGPHLIERLRERLRAEGARSAAELARLPDGARVRAAGAVIVRQRPGTAKGFVFLTLEDETGMAQAIIHPALFQKERAAIVGARGLVVEGVLQNREGPPSVRAETVRALDLSIDIPSHDFH